MYINIYCLKARILCNECITDDAVTYRACVAAEQTKLSISRRHILEGHTYSVVYLTWSHDSTMVIACMEEDAAELVVRRATERCVLLRKPYF